MSDLHRAVQDELDAYRPDQVPPFADVLQRKRSRDRRRYAAAGLAVGAIAVGAVTTAGSLFGRQGNDRLPSAAPQEGRTTLHVTFEPHRMPAPGTADLESVRSCVGAQADIISTWSKYPGYVVTLLNERDGDGTVITCLKDLQFAASVTAIDPLPSQETKTYTLRYSVKLVSNPNLEGDRRACTALPGVVDVMQLQSEPVQYRVTVAGTDEQTAFEACIGAVAGNYTPELTNDATFIDRCVGSYPGTPAPEFIGLAEAEATADKALGGSEPVTSIRVYGRDGECIGGTRDLRSDRINILVRDGKVIHATRF